MDGFLWLKLYLKPQSKFAVSSFLTVFLLNILLLNKYIFYPGFSRKLVFAVAQQQSSQGKWPTGTLGPKQKKMLRICHYSMDGFLWFRVHLKPQSHSYKRTVFLLYFHKYFVPEQKKNISKVFWKIHSKEIMCYMKNPKL